MATSRNFGEFAKRLTLLAALVKGNSLKTVKKAALAADLAAVLKDYQRGTLVGTETGGFREHFAHPQTFTLKHSRFNYEVSTAKLYPPLPRLEDAQRGTAPDVELTPSMLAPHLQDADPSLSFLLTTMAKRLEEKP